MLNPSLISVYVSYKTHHMNIRTYLMAAVTVLTVVGFAMMAYGNNQASKLIGYCECNIGRKRMIWLNVRLDWSIQRGL